MSSPRRPAPEDLASATYRKSTYSGASNECVEIAELGQWVAVRDSADPDGPALSFPIAAFDAFVADVKHGRLAH